jgi:hypothetical protein
MIRLAKRALLVGYLILGWCVWDFIRNGLHPDDRKH